jgi:hypothetical protein
MYNVHGCALRFRGLRIPLQQKREGFSCKAEAFPGCSSGRCASNAGIG